MLVHALGIIIGPTEATEKEIKTPGTTGQSFSIESQEDSSVSVQRGECCHCSDRRKFL
jgi:hypothetical protein